MWRPPERIKHSLPDAVWPDSDRARAAAWFSPYEAGRLRLARRTWVPAMVPWRSTDEGYVTDDNLEWYARFAHGRPGAIVVEATGIRDVPSGPLLRAGHDRFVPGLRRLVETVKQASAGETRLFIQLIDFLGVRRRPVPEKYFTRYLEVTDRHRDILGVHDDEAIRQHLAGMPADELATVLDERELESLRFGYRERVTDLHIQEIRELPAVLPGLFADASRRAEAAGFDGVELHYAHAYTMASFLSAKNDRDDGYGGSRENRLRLPVEVLRAVRAAVSDELVVGCRFLADECIDGGSDVDDAAFFGAELAAAGMDFLSLSRGGKFDDAEQPEVGSAVYPYTGQSGYECMPTVVSDEQGPFGRNVAAVATVRRAVRERGQTTPIVLSGGICTLAQAESVLADGTADIVGAARQSLADPDWFRKVEVGRGAEVRRCEFTNYCEALDQKHKQVTCQLWDRLDRDSPGVSLTADGRRRLVAPDWDCNEPHPSPRPSPRKGEGEEL